MLKSIVHQAKLVYNPAEEIGSESMKVEVM